MVFKVHSSYFAKLLWGPEYIHLVKKKQHVMWEQAITLVQLLGA